MTSLVQHLITTRTLTTKRIITAFRSIDRKDFVLSEYQDDAYLDTSLPIGYKQTISQPTTVAIMFELLQPKKGEKILDVGSGSGWTTALLAHIVGTKGKVYGVERVPELVRFSKENIKKYKRKNSAIMQASEELGYPQHAPYDKILVSAACDAIPRELLDQLKVKGVMIIPIDHALHKVQKVSQTKTKIEVVEGFAFVPLIH